MRLPTGERLSHPRFSIIPAGAVTDRSLEPRDLQVLCLLGRHTDKLGWCTRSQVRMAQELDCSRGSVQNSLDRLSGAGWIEMKRRDTEVEEAGKRPSRSYAYRVLLDRDDYAFESVTKDADDDIAESHAENASDEGGCQPVGTPLPTDEHPGANPCVGTPANPYDGTKNDPLERPPLERERDARARDRKARFLVSFETRWPSAAADDRQRTAYAAGALSEDEEEPALAGIGPFLANLKRLKRDRVPAGWRYLEEKRWTLLEQPKTATGASNTNYPAGSAEARAITVLYDIARSGEALRRIWRRTDGSIDFRYPMTVQLLALADAPPSSEWVELDHKQAGSWEALLGTAFPSGASRHHPRAGSRAPWPWAPSVTGKIYATGPPDALAKEDDLADFK
jgi:predicted transcriptional regulator